MFETDRHSKYAYIYMAQCLSNKVPPFCLAYLGTDNRFSAPDVINHWKYIYTECDKHKTMVVNFGSDGDSRNLRAMNVSCQFNLASCKKAAHSMYALCFLGSCSQIGLSL